MRIAFLNAKYNTNLKDGGSVHIRQFIEHATSLGHEIWMDARSDHPMIHRFPVGKLAAVKAIRRCDVIYIRLEGTPANACRFGVAPYKYLVGNKVIAWEFNTVPMYETELKDDPQGTQRSISRFQQLAPSCDLAIGVTNLLCDFVKNTIGVKNVLEAPNGSNPEQFRPDLPRIPRIPQDPKVMNVVWIGSANLTWNNFALMRDAAERLQSQGYGDKIRFHVLGAGMSDTESLPTSIHYHGHASYDRLPYWLASMDVGLILYRKGSADYGSPLKLFDYLSSGLAVAGVKHTQTIDITRQFGGQNLLVDHDDSDALAKVFVDLHEDPVRRKQLGDQGRKLIVERYSWRHIIRNIMSNLESLL